MFVLVGFALMCCYSLSYDMLKFYVFRRNYIFIAFYIR